ncbi:MAG: hypothetical protein R3B53_04475 [Candidatus Paceibacterota bacterium]
MELEIKHVPKKDFQNKILQKNNRTPASVSFLYLSLAALLTIIGSIMIALSFFLGKYTLYALPFSFIGTFFSIQSYSSMRINWTQPLKSMAVLLLTISITLFSIMTSIASFSSIFVSY